MSCKSRKPCRCVLPARVRADRRCASCVRLLGLCASALVVASGDSSGVGGASCSGGGLATVACLAVIMQQAEAHQAHPRAMIL